MTTRITNTKVTALVGDHFQGTTWQGMWEQWQNDLNASGSDIDNLNAGKANGNSFTVANLPTTASEGQLAYATNGRKVGEGAGAGTGVPVYWSNGQWRVYSTDAQVQA